MVSIEFFSKYPKESKKSTMFLLVIIIISVLLNIFLPESKKTPEDKKIESRQPNPSHQ
jgi:competence protein ComGC